MNKVLYIHGLASCGSGTKARALGDHFGHDNLVAPDLPMDPEVAVSMLEEILSTNPIDLMVGSSLGGFYAMVLNGLNPTPTVLVNPTTQPWISLRAHIGTHENWCTGEPFELTADHLSEFEQMHRQPDPSREAYLVLLGEIDEVLDPRIAEDFFRDFQVRLIRGDDHRLRTFSSHFGAIDDFLLSASTTAIPPLRKV